MVRRNNDPLPCMTVTIYTEELGRGITNYCFRPVVREALPNQETLDQKPYYLKRGDLYGKNIPGRGKSECKDLR